MTNLLGKKAFADHLGLAPSYVTALIKAGRVVLDGEGRTAKVKVAETMALIESTSAGRFDVARRHAAARLGREKNGQPVKYYGQRQKTRQNAILKARITNGWSTPKPAKNPRKPTRKK